MTKPEFDALPPEQQQPLAEYWGCYLGSCRRPNGTVLLYHYSNPAGGFYVEIHNPAGAPAPVRIHTFGSSLPLATDLQLWQPVD